MKRMLHSAALLLAVAAQGAELPRVADEVHVQAKVVAVKLSPPCGVVHFGSLVTYQVQSGAPELTGRRITAVVSCLEMPRKRGEATFAVGEKQSLVLTTQNVHGIEFPSTLSHRQFFLRSASATE